MRKKVNDNSGSALLLAIIGVMLVSIMIGIMFSQIINQINFNKSTLEHMQAKYAADAGIENTVAKISKQIEDTVNKTPKETNVYVGIGESTFEDISRYKVEEIKNTNISIVYNKNKKDIQSVGDVTFDIISYGYSKKSIYKIKANITFKTEKKNNNFITNYYINKYDKIS